jgi:hypothetical protein
LPLPRSFWSSWTKLTKLMSSRIFWFFTRPRNLLMIHPYILWHSSFILTFTPCYHSKAAVEGLQGRFFICGSVHPHQSIIPYHCATYSCHLDMSPALRAWVNGIFGSRNVGTLTCQPFSCPC